MFDAFEPALAWLGFGASSYASALYPLRERDADDALLRRLHQLLTDERFTLRLGQAARQLGMSERTLQRKLNAARTTFQAESARAKLAMAKTLMLSGAHNLTAIALELGFGSLQHFSTRFRASHGVPPSRWLQTQQR